MAGGVAFSTRQGPLVREDNRDAGSILKLTLHNTTDDSKTEHDFICQDSLNSITVTEVKTQVEVKYSVPACCQALYFESTLLRDQNTLAQSWLRDGDTIVIRYNTTADVKEVIEIVTLLRQFLEKVEEYTSSAGGERQVNTNILQLGSNVKTVRDLVFNSFRDASERSDANRLLFVHKNGVETLYKLYGLILKTEYQKAIFQMRYLESVLIQVLGSALIDSSTRIPLLRKQVLGNPTLEYVLKSFTRVMIPHGKRIVAPSGPREHLSVPANIQDQILAMCLQMSQVNTSK